MKIESMIEKIREYIETLPPTRSTSLAKIKLKEMEYEIKESEKYLKKDPFSIDKGH